MGKLLSDRDANRIQQMLRCWERSGGGQIYRRNPRLLTAGAELQIFEVQSAVEEGDGLYTCYKQILDADKWSKTAGDDMLTDSNTDEVTVLNLHETDVIADYSPALAKYDLLATWQMRDDDGEQRRVGIPLSGGLRIAKATEDATDSASIKCNLQLRDGSYAASEELGYDIDVYGLICNAENLDVSTPCILEDDLVSVFNQGGKWYLATVMQGWKGCDCYVV